MIFNRSASQVVTSLFTTLLIAAALTDIFWLQVPNWIPIAVAVLLLTAAVVERRSSLYWWGSHLAAGLTVLLVGLAFFASGLLGGGDVKLLAALALWFGLPPLPRFLLATVVAGVAVIFICLLLRSSGTAAWLELHGLHAMALQNGKGAPMAVAIATGCCLMRRRLLT